MAVRNTDTPVVLIKWYDFTKWLLERIDNFPKNQRFIFGQRLADYALNVLELLVEAAHSSRKADLLAEANRKIEMLRWLVRLAQGRALLSGKQYEFCCQGHAPCLANTISSHCRLYLLNSLKWTRCLKSLNELMPL